ncbi:MAG: nuclear transport factor 2 family protein [Steroidobacteraceae bacterium]
MIGKIPMRLSALAVLLWLVAGLPPVAHAQVPVVGATDPDALFHSSDPRLDANMQVAYHIEKDLLEANHWELAGKYLTNHYEQHNPNAASGLPAVINFFTKVMHVKPTPIPAKLGIPIVSVVAMGDLVIVATPREYKDAKHPGVSYTTTWFDMWRMKDGKADEHWDCATKL